MNSGENSQAGAAAVKPQDKASYAIIACLFFASGFSSLIYQVVWSRLLVFVFGSTTFATASVLAVFMGGLALGSFFAAKYSDRVRRPLLCYGILELVIGAWALAVPLMLDSAIALYKVIWLQFHLSPMPFALLRLAVAIVVLILPTACMGATLPFVSRYVVESSKTIGARIGSLYSVNTFGAVCGATLAGFIVLPAFGLRATTWVSAAINFILFFIVFALSSKREGAPSTKPDSAEQIVKALETKNSEFAEAVAVEASPSAVATRVEPTEADEPSEAAQSHPTVGVPSAAGIPSSAEVVAGVESATPLESAPAVSSKVGMAVLAFGISGALAMIYEVGWTRALLLVIGSGTYAFTCMLSTFLIGIFLGSWFCARVIDRNKDPLLVFALLQVAAAVCATIALLIYNFLPVLNLVLAALLAQNPAIAIASKFACAAATLLPLTIALGASFPAVVRACVNDLNFVGKSVGTLYGANTCGAIAGAFLSGFCLIPLVGVEKTILITAICNFILGCALLQVAPTAAKVWRVGGLAGAFCLTVFAFFAPAIWNHSLILLAQPLRRNHSDPKSVAGILLNPEMRQRALAIVEVLFFADGISSNVGVMKMKDSGHTLLLTNGNVDGGDSLDMGTQIMLALFPFIANPDIKDVCVVGYGTGVSTGTALCFPVKTVTSIELENKVFDAARLFAHINHDPESDSRSHFVMEDGRNFLLATDQKFDLIVSEPSNPWQAGVCNLYTQEYFQNCNKHLKPGGILSCWLQTTELSPASVRSILAAIRGSFKQQLVFGTVNGPDIVILASDTPLHADLRAINAAFKRPSVKQQLERSMILSPAQAASCVKADTATVATICGATAPNSDDRNYLEYEVCKTYETANFAKDNLQMFDEIPVKFDDVMVGEQQDLKAATIVKMTSAALASKRFHQAISWSEHSIPGTDSRLVCLAGTAEWELGNRDAARKLWDHALTINPDDDTTLVALARVAIENQNAAEAATLCQHALKTNASNCFANYFLGLYAAAPASAILLANDQELREFPLQRVSNAAATISYLSKVTNAEESSLKYPNSFYIMAMAEAQNGNMRESENYLRKYALQQPFSISGKRALGGLLWARGERLEAACLWNTSSDNGRAQSKQCSDKAEKLITSNQLQAAADQLKKALELWPANYDAQDLLSQLNGKIPETKTLMKMLEQTGAVEAAQEARRIATPPNDMVSKVIELLAAGMLLLMALRKRK